MVLYEMLAVVRARGKDNIQEVKEVARTASSLIIANGGVVRGITNWGRFLLTKPTRNASGTHHSGHHFVLRFDASPRVQQLVKRTTAVDPRMIRTGLVKLGSSLRKINDVEGTVVWDPYTSNRVTTLAQLLRRGSARGSPLKREESTTEPEGLEERTAETEKVEERVEERS